MHTFIHISVFVAELKQRQKPSQGKMGQWEHELVCHKYVIQFPIIISNSGSSNDGSGSGSGSSSRSSCGFLKHSKYVCMYVCRYEKPLLLQICRLLRGFTHPGTYFEASTEELALYRFVHIQWSLVHTYFYLCMYCMYVYYQCGEVFPRDGHTVGDHSAVHIGGEAEHGSLRLPVRVGRPGRRAAGRKGSALHCVRVVP